MKRILYPNKNTLLVFGLLSFVALVIYVWYYSFTWEFIFGLAFYIKFLLIILFIGFLISSNIDKKKKSKLKYYFLISFTQLLFIWVMSIPIRNWQIEYSKEKAMTLVNFVEKHKIKFGNYPKSLTTINEKSNLDVPKWTALGTKYSYKLFENGNYSIGFKSYYGYDLHYDNLNKNWTEID